ncbi:MAG TPA: beta-L-arabinofuranosidase domain-containing protein [Verrucomicrobiae bacterium]|nr:beta-L-arabinofuranosidase domain-containing protein [Verrucomicrobiae bacterium]
MKILESACLVAAVSLSMSFGAEISIIDRPDPSGPINHYVANRQPLAPSPAAKLPVGAVRPTGWLKKQLQLQANGFHGHLTEISDFLKKENNAWLSKAGEGQRGWEEPPYWLKGFLITGYLLEDERMIKEAHTWIEAALDSQKPDGWFGPDKGRTGVATDLKGRDDLWPNMIMLYCLQSYYERTSDPRVLELMRKYFRYLESVPEDKFLLGYWPSIRGGDQLYSILWLYNRTGESWLLDLAHKTHRKTARWDIVTDTPGKEIANFHNVNITQAFREPATYWMLSKDEKHLTATEQVWRKVRDLFGQVPGGMFGADENARPGHKGPRQAIETCGIAEEMLSDETLIAITGNPVWAERCENATFNSLPAAFTADMKALRYLTAPNLPQSDHGNKAPAFENEGDMLHMNPHSHRCCQHNAGHAWPYFTEHLWYAAPGNGLAAYIYSPCVVTAKVADGADVRISEQTKYPFEERIEFNITLSKRSTFPLYLRIPEWCDDASIELNDIKSKLKFPPGKLAKIERAWRSGDKLALNLPMKIAVGEWSKNHGTVSVDRGPLTYSLYIKEDYKRQGGTDAWPAWDIFPASPWNYGLVNPNPAAFKVFKREWPSDDQPFQAEHAPIALQTKARRISNWTLDAKGAINEVVDQPVKSKEPEEVVTLIPMGAARLRISAFPVVDNNNPKAREWPAAK